MSNPSSVNGSTATSAATMHEVRDAFRVEVDTAALDDDVAPLWNEVLPRIDAMIANGTVDLSPRPPGPDPPGSAQQIRLLGRLTTELAALARANPDNPAIERATEVVRSHLALAAETALRSPRST